MEKENKRGDLKGIFGENKKESKKIFTNDKCNNIMSKDYNPLNKEQQSKYEREGLVMKETRDIVLDEIMKELNSEERQFVEMYPNECIKLYKKGMIDCFNYYNKDGTF